MYREWTQTETGLHVPTEHAVRRAQRVDTEERHHRRLEIRFTSLQTWATILALVISAGGLWLGYGAFEDQHQVNQAQQAITREQGEREKRRYADRVTWWEERNTSGKTLHVENRSTGPIQDIALDGAMMDLTGRLSEDRFFVLLGDLPPCSSSSFRIARGSKGYDWHATEIQFEDTVGEWEKGPGYIRGFARKPLLEDWFSAPLGPNPEAQLLSRPYRYGESSLAKYTIEIHSLSDCGES